MALNGKTTSAMSIRIPFGRPLKVGGKSERRAKCTSIPAGAELESASTVTVKLFAVDGGVSDGMRMVLTCVQSPVGLATRGVEYAARRVPSAAWSASVRLGGEASEDNAAGRR
jgi:hypothetical protein